MVPPLIVPPCSTQAPMAGANASVVPALFSVPVRFTVLPLALNLPRPPLVKEPPRLTVAPLAVMVPIIGPVAALHGHRGAVGRDRSVVDPVAAADGQASGRWEW